ncbi:hypothetical protein [Oceanospirillum maris]|uniref:hypothetical protein n=1 Tax=Oceanospirillum maris TaxID=64977 RepID=UPI0004851EC7|nr:hypothetical protein [Oceanospirillum maris]
MDTAELNRLYNEWQGMEKHTASGGEFTFITDPKQSITIELFAEYLGLKGIQRCPICQSEELAVPEVQDLIGHFCQRYQVSTSGVQQLHPMDQQILKERGVTTQPFTEHFALDCLNCGHRALFSKNMVTKNIDKLLGKESE